MGTSGAVLRDRTTGVADVLAPVRITPRRLGIRSASQRAAHRPQESVQADCTHPGAGWPTGCSLLTNLLTLPAAAPGRGRHEPRDSGVRSGTRRGDPKWRARSGTSRAATDQEVAGSNPAERTQFTLAGAGRSASEAVPSGALRTGSLMRPALPSRDKCRSRLTVLFLTGCRRMPRRKAPAAGDCTPGGRTHNERRCRRGSWHEAQRGQEQTRHRLSASSHSLLRLAYTAAAGGRPSWRKA